MFRSSTVHQPKPRKPKPLSQNPTKPSPGKINPKESRRRAKPTKSRQPSQAKPVQKDLKGQSVLPTWSEINSTYLQYMKTLSLCFLLTAIRQAGRKGYCQSMPVIVLRVDAGAHLTHTQRRNHKDTATGHTSAWLPVSSHLLPSPCPSC